MTNEERNEKMFKVVFIGDSGVGKSRLFSSCTDTEYENATIAGSFYLIKEINLEGKLIKLQFMDANGLYHTSKLAKCFTKNNDGYIFAYDITKRKSFENIQSWMNEVNPNAPQDAYRVLVGCKCDCEKKRAVRKEEGERFAGQHCMPFFETSAKNSINVEEMVMAIAKAMKNKTDGLCINVNNNIDINVENFQPNNENLQEGQKIQDNLAYQIN